MEANQGPAKADESGMTLFSRSVRIILELGIICELGSEEQPKKDNNFSRQLALVHALPLLAYRTDVFQIAVNNRLLGIEHYGDRRRYGLPPFLETPRNLRPGSLPRSLR